MGSFHFRTLLKKPAAARGFTLVELLVSLMIISVITAIAVFGQTKFNQSLLLTDTAYTVALSMREAQTFGLSSRNFNSVQNAGYGVEFDASRTGSYVIFADISHTLTAPATCPTGLAGTPEENPGNCLYDGAAEQVQNYAFSRGFTVQKFCGTKFNGDLVCTTITSGTSERLSTLHVTFLRPNTESIISGIETNNSIVSLTDATVYLQEPNSLNTRCVSVSQVGQVTVLQQCP